MRWRLTELFHSTIQTTNTGLELSLKTQRRKTSTQKTTAAVAWINGNGENIYKKKHKMAFARNPCLYDADINISGKKKKYHGNE